MDEISVVVRLVDEASSQMQSLVANMEGAMSSISSTATDASSSLTEIGSSASDAANSISEVGNAANETSDAVSTAANSAEELDSATSNITSTNIDEVANAATEASTSLNSTSTSAEELATSLASVNATDLSSAAASADSLKGSLDKTAESAQELTNNSKEATTTLANTGGSVVGLAAIAGALGAVTAGMEMAARDATNLNTTFQKMASAKMPEPAVRSFVASLVSAKLPLEDVIGYMKLLKQAGVSSAEGLRAGIIGLNNLALATGTTRDEISRFANSLIVMGIRLDEVHKAYNAVAYAQANIVGGFATYIKWMEKFDSEFRKLGLNIDQTAVLIAAATKKFGGGRAAYTGLSQALKECNGDLSVLEQKLGMQPGTLARASEMTSKYAGTIDRKSKIEKNNVTIMQMLQTELDKLKIRFSWLIGPITNVGGLISGLVGLYSVYLTYQSAVSMAASAQALSEMTKAGATEASTAATSQNIVVTTLQAAANRVVAIGTALYTAALEGNLIALIAQTVATKAATAAQWLFNAAMSANPIMWVVIAIGALVAALIYLYYNYKPVTDAVNWFINGLKQVGGVIYGYLLGAFEAVKGALSAVGSAISGALGGVISWIINGLMEIGKAVYYVVFSFQFVDDMTSKFGVVGLAISYIINPIRTLIEFINQLKIAWDAWSKTAEGQEVFKELGEAFGELKAAFGEVWNALQPAIQAIQAAFRELWVALFPVSSEAKKAGDGLKDTGSAANDAKTPIQLFVDIIKIFADFLQYVVVPVIKLLAEGIRLLAPGIGLLASILATLIGWVIQGAIWFINLARAVWAVASAFGQFVWSVLTTIWQIIMGFIQLPGQIISILWGILTGTMSWSEAWKILGSNAAVKFVISIINFLISLPGRVFNILKLVLSRVVAWISQLWAKGVSAGRGFVDKVVSFLKDLPSKVGQILMDAINVILGKVGDAFNAAVRFAQGIWDGIKSALHIKSPSIIYKQLKSDVDAVNDMFKKRAAEGRAAAALYAYGLREGLEPALSATTTIATTIPAGTTPTTTQAPATQETRTQMNEVTKTGLEAVNTTTQQGMAAINNTTNTGLQTIISTWTGIKETTTKTQAAMTNTQTITKSAMSTMVNTTKNAMDSMKNGFNSMKNEVISAASKAKSGVVSHIDTLSANIKQFYRLVTNPGAGGPAGGPVGSSIRKIAGAGAPVSRKIMTTPSLKLGFGALPEPLTPSEPLKSPSIHDISSSRKAQKIAEEFYRMLSCPSCFAYGAGGGWDYSDEWISWIKKQIGSYRVSILPGLNIKAGDFVTYPPKGIAGNLASFIAVMSAIIGRTRYAFYYGSSGLSVAQLLARGYFNCYDGARIVVAYANAFGLPAYMSCGLSWAGIPHCAANVAGMWFDTTAFQQGHGWTSPKVSGYGGPSGLTLDSIVSEAVKGAVSLKGGESNVNVNIDINLENVPEHISERELTAMLKQALQDDTIIDTIAKNPRLTENVNRSLGFELLRHKRSAGV
ncbi:MAG TPA: phage tail tape measure protein [Candidatus Hydrothermia bacterium]|nr:phage tail tape measure protein [Candidatus Hydrothermia bacterium]